jgi:hypothetical protein
VRDLAVHKKEWLRSNGMGPHGEVPDEAISFCLMHSKDKSFRTPLTTLATGPASGPKRIFILANQVDLISTRNPFF